jgi:hypothetical protein
VAEKDFVGVASSGSVNEMGGVYGKVDFGMHLAHSQKLLAHSQN